MHVEKEEKKLKQLNFVANVGLLNNIRNDHDAQSTNISKYLIHYMTCFRKKLDPTMSHNVKQDVQKTSL